MAESDGGGKRQELSADSSSDSCEHEKDYTLVDISAHHLGGVEELARHTYGGHDWITTEFEKWMDRSSYIALGLEHSSTKFLAALYVLRVVKADHQGCLEGLRVHPDHRGKSLSHRIHREMMARARERRNELGIANVTYTCYDENYASLKVARKAGLKVIYRFPYMMITDDVPGDENAFVSRKGPGSMERFFKECATAFNTLAKPHRKERIRECSDPNECLSAFNQIYEEQHERAMIHQSWKPFYVSLASLELLLKNHKCFLGVDDANNCFTSISFGTMRPEHNGAICIVSVYVRPSESSEGAAESFLRHLVERWTALCVEAGAGSMYTSYPLVSHETLHGLGIYARPVPQQELVFGMDL